jgi:hypothetical protein
MLLDYLVKYLDGIEDAVGKLAKPLVTSLEKDIGLLKGVFSWYILIIMWFCE